MENCGILKTKTIMRQFFYTFLTIVVLSGCAAPISRPVTDQHTPDAVWNEMKGRLAAGDIQGAVSCFSIASRDDYQKTFLSMSKTDLTKFLKNLGPIKQASNDGEKAQYYYENVIDGKTITFPVEFDKENGDWKIVEF